MEKIFYENADLRGTSEIRAVGGMALPIGDVVSVQQRIEEPAKIGIPGILVASGVVGTIVALIVGRPAAAFLLVLLSASAGLWRMGESAQYTISVVKLDGISDVITTRDKAYARAVLGALESSIAYRNSMKAERE